MKNSFRHMAVAKSNLGFRLVVSCLLLLITDCQSAQRHFNKHVALFIFGDSLFDSGNNNYINTNPNFQAKFWPYGESYFNPPAPSGRFSNGRLIPDFIAEFAGLPLIPAYLDPHYHNKEFGYGANFASGGSGALVETNGGLVVDLKTQLQYFLDLEKRFRKNLGNLTDVFKEIHEKGGRKIGIAMIPPLGCLPIARAQQPCNTCYEEFNTIASLHNRAVSKKMKEMTKQFEGFMFANYDHSTALSKRMKNPSKYGFLFDDHLMYTSIHLHILFEFLRLYNGDSSIGSF
ncbi:unnamed protein product [Lactuca saligna]|uniref:GDSL esterase/lipase 1-like n=1 Tax=Lactuca saligna TaxID=75948 RepID=A0AA36E9Y3_LACSI|nr:unnamed protein product [Lactuca saligna]